MCAPRGLSYRNRRMQPDTAGACRDLLHPDEALAGDGDTGDLARQPGCWAAES